MDDFLQYLGGGLSIAGSLLMSLNIPISRHAWKLWLVANFSLSLWGFREHAWGIMAMQLVFVVTSVTGIIRHHQGPRRGRWFRRKAMSQAPMAGDEL